MGTNGKNKTGVAKQLAQKGQELPVILFMDRRAVTVHYLKLRGCTW